ncbi:phosphoribosyl-AMP cyclohydrolase [Roseibium sp. HPY-6]|uniref:phosphoribosyl-AMP cyclohydrolase n=1 Tax=Roseibium sp. HPY-6 TaxID=3229852 RepID=UPI0033906E03
MMTVKSTIVASAALSFVLAGTAFGEDISKQAVIDAQIVWGKGIVEISTMHAEGADFKARAENHVKSLYAYGDADVMFKPTLAAKDQFRETYDEALSYFIGTEGSEDSGFAIKGWTKVRWENNGIHTTDETAMAMGNYFFTGPDGKEVKVEYTFGYVKSPSGDLKINLHHSSLPYDPAK